MTPETVKYYARLMAVFAAAAAMLTVIQPPLGIDFLAWVAYVPLILISSPKIRPKPLAISAYLVAAVYWLGNIYWMGYVTKSGWIAFCLYTALLWPILVLCLRFCRKKNIPLLIAAPVLIAGAEQLQGLFLGGFFWRFLAHSQYSNISVIQIADIFGASGVSFLIAMVNALVAVLILAFMQKKLLKPAPIAQAALVAAALVATIMYGNWRIDQSDQYITQGPLVGSVQPNVPQTVKDSPDASEQILADLITDSNSCFDAGAMLVIWPETMVQAVLEPQVLALMKPSRSHTFNEIITNHSKGKGYILAGAIGGRVEITPQRKIVQIRQNTAFLYGPDGKISPQQYSKIHLVPFGETMPFKKSCKWLYNFFMLFSPYDYDYSLDPGTKYTVFSIENQAGGSEQQYRFSVLICYEDAVPFVARKFALDSAGNKQIQWLVNISNDGWFVWFDEDSIDPSTELAQHAAVCAFRAVENRLAVIRSVNTGISCLIDSLGRIRDGYTAGNLPEIAMNRKGKAGWFVDRMPIDKRVTLFSRYGNWLDFTCSTALLTLAASLVLIRGAAKIKSRRKSSGKSNDKK